jgi:hypothetical protein
LSSQILPVYGGSSQTYVNTRTSEERKLFSVADKAKHGLIINESEQASGVTLLSVIQRGEAASQEWDKFMAVHP